VDPLSDVSKEEYFAAFELFENDTEHLAVGNSPKAWAYSAFNTSETGAANKVAGDVDLFSSRPEAYNQEDVQPYELPRRGTPCTIVFKVEYIPGADDLVTVWMNPNLSRGASEEKQLKSLTTKFKANASFNQIHLRHGGLGDGWTFSDMAIATSFNDFVALHFWQRWWFIAFILLFFVAAVAITVRFVERRKFQLQLSVAERERALEGERSRIARDLHDDLGSLLTRISLLSGLLRADKDNPAQVETHAAKISQSANQTVRALEEIVWAVRPGSDSLQSLIDYISHFAKELFEGDTAHCRLDLPEDLPAQPLPPDLRHNIFLVIKEALTNALKHAGAREVRLQVRISYDILEIRIQDNGKGFADSAAPEEGQRHGLGNMRSRAEAIGGTLSVESEAGKGTTIVVRVKLSTASRA
jgi:signal transduction histidine kinase